MLKRSKLNEVWAVGTQALVALSLLVGAFVVTSCSDKEKLSSVSESQFFVQDYNPEYLDILWVVDDRSPMYQARNLIIPEMRSFFLRIDSISPNYQMGMTTMDTFRNNGALKPSGTILTKQTFNSPSQRGDYFAYLIGNQVNLGTGAENTGFAASLKSLQNHFVSRPGVPLVIIFISDGDDFSANPSTSNVVDYYAAELLKLKGGKSDLLKVYSINYIDFAVDATAGRCATSASNSDIDKKGTTAVRTDGSAYFQDRYFKLAQKLGGETGDVCSGFATKISLDGIKLKELPSRFKLDRPANPDTLRVSISSPTQSSIEIRWSLDASTNEIVFESTPPAGATIQVTFNAL